KRFFPATLGIDDPFVADELSLPTVSSIKLRGEGDQPPTRATDISGEFSKRLSPNLGFSLGGDWRLLDPDHSKTVTGFDNLEVAREVNASAAKWGFTVQYNLQYLQSYVRDVGLPAPLNRMIPIVEFVMQTPLDDPKNAGRTTGTVNPGIIWFGRYLQLGLEAVIPVNERSGKNVGVIGQIHFYLDDIAPQIFSWTPFHGVLGPTQPR